MLRDKCIGLVRHAVVRKVFEPDESLSAESASMDGIFELFYTNEVFE